MSVGLRFREAVDSIKANQGISIGDICKIIGITNSALSQYKKGEINPNFSTIRKLEKEFNVNYNYIVTGEGNLFKRTENENNLMLNLSRFVAKIDILESPSYESKNINLQFKDFIVGSRDFIFRIPVDDSKNFAALKMKDNSMKHKGILNKDLVIFRKQKVARNNQLVVILTNGQIFVNNYIINSDKTLLQEFDSLGNVIEVELDNSHEVLGIVTNVLRDY